MVGVAVGRVDRWICPFCFEGVSGDSLVKNGLYRHKGEERQKWLCRLCGGISAFPLSGQPKKRGERRVILSGQEG